jgi:hypothetical protein
MRIGQGPWRPPSFHGGQCPGGLTERCFGGYACERAVPFMRGSCEPVPEVIPIGKRPNRDMNSIIFVYSVVRNRYRMAIKWR